MPSSRTRRRRLFRNVTLVERGSGNGVASVAGIQYRSRVLNRLRHGRWLAALLIALSPALGGSAVSALHMCHAGDTAAMASMPGMDHGAMPMAPNGHSPQQPTLPAPCCDLTCVTCCYAAAFAPGASFRVSSVAVMSPSRVVWTAIESDRWGSARLALLPEQTAPPFA